MALAKELCNKIAQLSTTKANLLLQWLIGYCGGDTSFQEGIESGLAFLKEQFVSPGEENNASN